MRLYAIHLKYSKQILEHVLLKQKEKLSKILMI